MLTGLLVVTEKMRARWNQVTGVVYHKLTDVYPGVSWFTVDGYGVPKIAHYWVQRAFAPLHVVALFDSLQPGEQHRVRITFMPNVEGKLPSDRRFAVGAWNAEYVAIQWD